MRHSRRPARNLAMVRKILAGREDHAGAAQDLGRRQVAAPADSDQLRGGGERQGELLGLGCPCVVIGPPIGQEQAAMVAGGAGCRHGPGQLPLDDLGRCEPARLDQAPQRVEAEGQPGPSEIDAAAAVKREQQRRDGETALPGIEPEMNEIDIDRLEQLLERCPVAGLDAMAMRRRTSRRTRLMPPAPSARSAAICRLAARERACRPAASPSSGGPPGRAQRHSWTRARAAGPRCRRASS